jgi:hypothetical protein
MYSVLFHVGADMCGERAGSGVSDFDRDQVRFLLQAMSPRRQV